MNSPNKPLEAFLSRSHPHVAFLQSFSQTRVFWGFFYREVSSCFAAHAAVISLCANDSGRY